MAGLLALVIYLEVYSGVRVCWLDVLVNNFFHNPLFLLVRCREECSVEDLNLILLFSRVWVIRAIYNFLSLFYDVLFTEAIVDQNLRRALDLVMDLFPCSAVGEDSSNVGAGGRIFIPLRAFTPSIMARVGGLGVVVYTCVLKIFPSCFTCISRKGMDLSMLFSVVKVRPDAS